MLVSCWLFNYLQLHEMLSAELPGSKNKKSTSSPVLGSSRCAARCCAVSASYQGPMLFGLFFIVPLFLMCPSPLASEFAVRGSVPYRKPVSAKDRGRRTLQRRAIRPTALDHPQREIGCPRFRHDSDKNNRPRSRLSSRRTDRYWPKISPVGAEYGTTRSRRLFVASERIRRSRCAGLTSVVSREQTSSRRSAAS
jgi:hypothetical protein